MPYFICPSCGRRSIDHDRREGLSHQAVGCHVCGFGFLFELLEDYYPPPGAGLLACDRDGRILSAGRGVFELTGFSERDLMGKDLREALTLAGENGKDPVATTLEWGVRQMAQPMTLRSRAGLTKRVVGDFFPAYDEDGGMLASIAPASSR
jgi:PAS domain-containing protein